MTNTDALDLALGLLRTEAEKLNVAGRMIEMLGDSAPPDTRKDAARRERLVKAAAQLEAMKRNGAG